MELLIPITFFVMIAAVVVGPIWITSRAKTLERAEMQATLRTALEKGQPLPPEMIDALKASTPEDRPSSPENDLRRGLVLIFVGLGLVGLGLGLYVGLAPVGGGLPGTIAGGCTAGAGAIPGMIGLAYLILYLLNRGRRPVSSV